MLKTKKIVMIVILYLLISTVFAEYPTGLYYDGSHWKLSPTDTCYDDANDIFGRCRWGLDWECDRCKNILGQYYDCNCGWTKYNENIPSTSSNSWSDSKICIGGVPAGLHLDDWIRRPGCTFFANDATDDPEYGAASCDFGYLDCTNAVFEFGSGTSCVNMGCETPCNQCKPGDNSATWGCPEPADPGKKSVCVAQANCYTCDERHRACEYAFNDNHCDRYTDDGDSYFCYYGGINTYSLSGASVDLDCPAFDPNTGEDNCNYINCYDCDDPNCHSSKRCGLRANPYKRICIKPVCDAGQVYCDDGRICKNGGLWNAFCARPLQQGANFLAETIKPLPMNLGVDPATGQNIPGPDHLFIVYERAGRIYLDIYYDPKIESPDPSIALTNYSSTDLITDYTVVMRRISNGAYFTIDGQVYRAFFSTSLGVYDPTDYSLDVFTVDFYDRLTYNIFPVCGNGICETCESLDNCLHYPPESCMSCPVDCPYVEDAELNEFNEAFPGENINFGDILVDNDLSCKIKTVDLSSVCNPLCVTHDFIDANGCVYNRYRPAQPVTSNGKIISGKFGNRTAKLVNFKDENLVVVVDASGDLLGEAHEDTYYTINQEIYEGKRYPGGIPVPYLNASSDLADNFFLENKGGNSECISDCECATSHCSKSNTVEFDDVDYGHCCPEGYEWSNEDPFGNLYCDGEGHLKSEYRDFFEAEEDDYGNCYVKSTLGLTTQGAVVYDVARQLTEFICSTGQSSTIGGTCKGDKAPCITDGFDPMCTYQQLNGDYEPIEANGVWQCRKVETVTESVIPDIKCVVHSHAWALSECQDLDCNDWGCVCWDDWNPLVADTPRHVPYCITDNIDECSGALKIEHIISSDVVLRTISYEDFCTTEALVCGYSSKFTNSKTGGTLEYNNCPQDAMGNVGVGGWSRQVGYNSPDYPFTYDGFPTLKEYYSSYEITVGRYCSLFGNDFERIIENKDLGRSFKTGSCDSTAGSESLNAKAYSDANGFIDVFGLYSYYVWYEAFPVPFANLAIGQTYHYLVNTENMKEDDCDNGVADLFTTGSGDKGDNGEDYKVMKTHLPSIDRDASEEFYHYLWNYETCKEIFRDRVPDCDWSSIDGDLESWDENDYPTHPETGVADFERHAPQERPGNLFAYQHDANYYGVPVYSRKYCEAFWTAYEAKYGEYDWDHNSANEIARLNNIKRGDTISFSYEDVEGETHDVTITFNSQGGGTLYPENGLYSWEITASCIFWYDKFLNYYYDESAQNPIPWYVAQIIPPWADYYRYNLDLVRNRGSCDSNTDKRIGPLADSDYPYQ